MDILKGLFAVAASLVLSVPNYAAMPTIEYLEPPPVVETKVTEPFVEFLVKCESGGNERAINPLDKDGFPSWGLLQFKPDTLFGYVNKYKTLPDIERQEIMNVIFDGELQLRVLAEMLKDPEVDWYQEFPACYRRWIAHGGYAL